MENLEQLNGMTILFGQSKKSKVIERWKKEGCTVRNNRTEKETFEARRKFRR